MKALKEAMRRPFQLREHGHLIAQRASLGTVLTKTVACAESCLPFVAFSGRPLFLVDAACVTPGVAACCCAERSS